MFLVAPTPVLGIKKLEYVTYVEAMSRSGSTMTAASLAGGAGGRKYFLLHWWSTYNNRTINALDYGSTSCTRIARAEEGTTPCNVELWYGDSAASSDNLVATFSGSMVTDATTNRERCDVAVFSGTPLTAIGTGRFSNNLTAGTLVSSAFDLPANGWVIAGMAKGESATMDASWSSFTEIADLNHSAFAFDAGLTAASGHVETVTMSGNRSYRRLLCVSFN